MVLTVSTSFASGTVSTASGTNITLATGTAVAGWVGRAFVLNRTITGRGGQLRKITAVNSATSIEVAYPWRTTLDAADSDFESVPLSGDAFHVSHFLDDIDNGTDILKVDARLYRNLGGLSLSNNVTIFDEFKTIDLGVIRRDAATALLGTATTGIIFGSETSNGATSGGCSIIINCNDPGSFDFIFNTTGSAIPDFILNGCSVEVNTATASQLFFFLNRSSTQVARLLNCQFSTNDNNGGFGGRISGSRSIVRRCDFVRNNNTIGPFTNASPMGDLSEIRVLDSVQSYFWNPSLGGSIAISNILAKNISGQIVSIAGQSNDGAVLTISNIEYDASVSNFIFWGSILSSPVNNRIDAGFLLSLTAVNSVSGALESGARVAIFDSIGVSLRNELSPDGRYTDTFIRTKFFNSPGSNTGVSYASGTARTPALVRFRQYKKRFFELSIQEESATKLLPQAFQWRKEDNIYATAADSTAALEITNPTTATQIYDHHDATYASESFMQYAAVITTADGVTLNVNCNVQISSALSSIAYTPVTPAVAVSAFNTGTFSVLALGASRALDLVQAATYSAAWSIPATGIVTVADGASNLSTFTFASGATINLRAGATAATVAVASVSGITAGTGVTLVAPVLTVTINGLTADTRLKIYNTGTQTLAAGVSNSGTSYDWTGFTPGNGYDIYAVLPGKLPWVQRNFIAPSASASLSFEQEDDLSYAATTGLAIDNASGANLGTSSDIYINITDPAAVRIQMATGFGLDESGLTWQRLYSRVAIEARYAADTYMPFAGLIVPTSVTAGEWIMTRGAELADATTRNLLRNGGVRYTTTAPATTAEWCNVTGIGELQTPASTTGYFVQDSATNATTTNFVNPGQPNQMIQIFGDATHGNFDRRDYLAVYARRLGEAGTRYDVFGAEGALKPQKYTALLSTATDLIITITADTQVDANADGTPDVAPFDGMSITWQTASGFYEAWDNGFTYPANSVVGSAGRFFITAGGGTSSGTGVADDVGITDWAAYAGERLIDGTYYCFQVITDLNGASYERIRDYHNWANRQSVDIDAGAANRTGRVADTLSSSRGAQVVLARGGFVDDFEIADQLLVVPVDVFGEEREFPAPPVALSAPNIKDPDYTIGVTLLRQETFVIADISAAINTTSNVLTLTGNALSIATPASFLAFIPQPGAALPTVAGGDAIEPLGLYFVKSVSGASVTLSPTEGGAELDFATAGTGTFVVRAWTEVDAQTVAAGSSSGYSVTLDLPSGTTLLLKARGYQNADLPATATEYLITEILWTASAQAIAATLNYSATPDTVHNEITAATQYTNDGESVAGITFDFDGTLQFDFDGGGILATQDVYAWYVWYTSTTEGRRYVGDVVEALNSANINVSPPIQFENVDDGTVLRLSGAFIRRTDGESLTYIGPTSGVIEYSFDQLAVPYTVTTGSGLDSTQSTQLTTLFNTTTAGTGATVFSTAALANAPSGGGGGGDATAANQTAIIAALGVVDGVVDEILIDTSTTVPAQIAALPAPLDATATQTAAAAALTAYDPPTKAELDAAVAGLSTLTAPQVWSHAERLLTGTQAASLAAIPTIPTNPLLAPNYTAPLDSTATTAAAAAAITAAGLSTLTGGDIATALTTYQAAKTSDVQVTVEPTPVTVDGGFSGTNAADLAAAKTAAEATEAYTRPMAKQLGLVEGVTATHGPEAITVSDGDGSTEIADNLDGSYTVSKAP